MYFSDFKLFRVIIFLVKLVGNLAKQLSNKVPLGDGIEYCKKKIIISGVFIIGGSRTVVA